MRVLVGCERSGVIRRAFRALGHDAWSCDLEPADDRSEYHFQCDILKLLRNERRGDGPWDIGIFHPECTYLSLSGVSRLHKTPPNPSPGKFYGAARWEAMREGAEFFHKLWRCRIPRVCCENPTMHGHALKIIGPDRNPPAIQPYQFGDDASKATCLWLRNLPPLVPTKFIEPRMVCGECGMCFDYSSRECPQCFAEASLAKPRWSNQTDSGQNKLTPSKNRRQLRAETYPGIAQAMALQWSNLKPI